MITGPGLVAYKQPFSTNFSKDVVERPLMVTLNQLKHLVVGVYVKWRIWL